MDQNLATMSSFRTPYMPITAVSARYKSKSINTSQPMNRTAKRGNILAAIRMMAGNDLILFDNGFIYSLPWPRYLFILIKTAITGIENIKISVQPQAVFGFTPLEIINNL